MLCRGKLEKVMESLGISKAQRSLNAGIIYQQPYQTQLWLSPAENYSQGAVVNGIFFLSATNGKIAAKLKDFKVPILPFRLVAKARGFKIR